VVLYVDYGRMEGGGREVGGDVYPFEFEPTELEILDDEEDKAPRHST
jgi:hypothetical protein